LIEAIAAEVVQEYTEARDEPGPQRPALGHADKASGRRADALDRACAGGDLFDVGAGVGVLGHWPSACASAPVSRSAYALNCAFGIATDGSAKGYRRSRGRSGRGMLDLPRLFRAIHCRRTARLGEG
jgi:hypothetical protein